MASILTVKEDGSRDFTVYNAAPENERDKGMQTKKMVRRLLPPQRVYAHVLLPEYDALLCLIQYYDTYVSLFTYLDVLPFQLLIYVTHWSLIVIAGTRVLFCALC